MRVTKKTNIYRCGLLAIVCFCLLFIGSLCLRDNRAASAADSGSQTIYVGDVIDATQYTLSYDGGSVKAEGFTAVYPSGGVYGGDSLTVEQAGIYKITYYANVQGNRIEETQSYTAVRKPKDIIYSTDGATISYGKYEVESPYQMKKETLGAIATFKAGTSIVFSTTIPTEKLTADYDIVDLIVMPSVFRETDFERLTIYVSDANDPNNYVEIVIDSSNTVDGDGQVSYVRAGANGQQIGGYEGSKYHTMNYGTQIEHSFRALARAGEFRDNHTVSEHSLTVAIDHSAKKVLCGPMSFDSTSKFTVNDLDDPVNYKGNPWSGFTSDEVTVKIVASAFTKATGTVVIKSFGDYDLAKDIEDTAAPQITLNYPTDEALPVATVGVDFPIIPFSAKDALDAQVKTSVYVYYLAPNGQRINVSHNGKSFFVKYEGEYEIVYRAEDYSGNREEKKIVISSYAKAPQIFIGLDEAELTADVYQTVSVKEVSEVQVFGGYGNLRLERTVYSPSGALLDVKDELLLTELGDYKVVYKATDYLQQVQYGVVTVHSVAVQEPTFVKTPDFNKVLIKGFQYALPQSFVIEVVDGKVVEVPCKAYVNGVLAGDSFIADGEVAEIEYVAEGKTGTSSWGDSLSVVDTEKGKYQSRYFQTEGNITVIDEQDYLQLAFTGDSKVEFIKELYSRGFSFVFSYDKEMANFTSLSVVLTNAADRDLSVTFHFLYEGAEDAWLMQVNGRGPKVAFGISKSLFGFTCTTDGLGIVDSSGVVVATVKEYDNGEPFNGFSDTLYFAVEFGGVFETSSINLTNLCNQVMGYSKSSIDKAKDDIKPVIFLNEEFEIRQKLGSEARIPTATACDVLGQISEFTVTVKKSDGTVLMKCSATKPEKLLLNEAGNYVVSYYAKDSNGKSTELSYMMLVYDETAPTLTITDSLAEEYKVGDKVSIPVYSAVDNGDSCYIQVELILPNNEVRLLQYSENGEVTSLLDTENTLYNSSFKADSNTFIVEKAGAYTLRFVAYDEYYNVVSYEMHFNVK